MQTSSYKGDGTTNTMTGIYPSGYTRNDIQNMDEDEKR